MSKRLVALATAAILIAAGIGGARADANARILKMPLGLPIQLVSGYKGTAEIGLAASSGEVAGACWSWESMRSTWRAALDSGEVVAVLQTSTRAFPDLAAVPLGLSLAKTDVARQLIKVGIQNPAAFARPLTLPPGTPKDRVLLLRKAFRETLKDPAYK